jgi:hypothetical protein
LEREKPVERATPEGYIDLYDTADELGISMATLWNLLKRYDIVRYRFPGKRRAVIKREDLEQLRQPIRLGRPRGTGGTEGKAAA